MSFENPYIFIILFVPFILFTILILTNKDGVDRVFEQKVLRRIRVEDSGLSIKARNSIFLSSIFFMIAALGHPYIANGQDKIEVGSLRIAMALDISSSMRSTDRYPNRLEFGKQKIKELLKEMPNDEFVLFTFSENIFLVSPMTSDKDTLNSVIDGITDDYLQNYTNFTTLANILKETLEDSNDKIAIIISDGGERKDLLEFENIIKDNNIKLYSILIGTKDGSPVLDRSKKTVIKNDQIVMTKVNEYLGKIAKESGGDYIVTDYGNSDIKKIVDKINSKFNATYSGKVINIDRKIELFYFPLIIAAFLLLLVFISTPTAKDFKFKKSTK